MTEIEAQQQLELVDAEIEAKLEELKSVPAYDPDTDGLEVAQENLNRQITVVGEHTALTQRRVQLLAKANGSKITQFHTEIKDILLDHVSLISEDYEALGMDPISTIVWTRESQEVIQENGVQETEYKTSVQVNPVSKRKASGTRRTSGDGVTSSSTAVRTVNGVEERMSVKDVCVEYATDEIKEMSAWSKSHWAKGVFPQVNAILNPPFEVEKLTTS